MPFGLKLNIKLFYFFNMLFMPLSWIILAGVGDSALKLFHLPVIFLLFSLVFKEYRKALIAFISRLKIFLLFFLMLMLLNYISLSFNSNVSPNAFSYIYKNIIYMMIFLLYGACLLIFFKMEDNLKFTSISNIGAIAFFLLLATFSFHGNFITELVDFFIKGDLDGIKKDVYKSLFNNGDASPDADVASNLLNQLTGSFIIIYYTSFYCYKNLNVKFYRITNIIAMVVSAALIIANLSRSNIIAWVFGYVLYYGCEIIINKNYKKTISIVFALIGVFFFLVLFWNTLSTKFDASSQMLQDRFGSQIEDNARWPTNLEAIDTFTENFKNFILGKGSGARLSDGHAVHNFVLGSAYQAGILGLILSVLIYLSMPFWLYKGLYTLSRFKFAFLIPPLLSVPLIRMMESGNAGTLTIQEWFCIAFFVAFLIVKKQELSANRLSDDLLFRPEKNYRFSFG